MLRNSAEDPYRLKTRTTSYGLDQHSGNNTLFVSGKFPALIDSVDAAQNANEKLTDPG